jgi:hypothetical protein
MTVNGCLVDFYEEYKNVSDFVLIQDDIRTLAVMYDDLQLLEDLEKRDNVKLFLCALRYSNTDIIDTIYEKLTDSETNGLKKLATGILIHSCKTNINTLSWLRNNDFYCPVINKTDLVTFRLIGWTVETLRFVLEYSIESNSPDR